MGDNTNQFFEEGNPRILVVDDLPADLELLQRLLTELPVEVISARSGEEALALAREHEFALALVDVQMPGMDGFETVERLHRLQAARDLPVIFISAFFADDVYSFDGTRSGVVGFLEKPIVPELLLGRVRLFVDMYRYRAALKRANLVLEAKVRERTLSLQNANDRLRQEIEERKSAQQALARSIESLEIAQKMARLGFYERNIQTGEETWSDGLCHLLGESPGAIPCDDASFLERVLPEDRGRVRAAFRQAQENKAPLDVEFRLLRPDGSERFIRAVGAVDCDEQGVPLMHRGTLQDITESKQAERDRLEFESRILHTQKLESLGVLAGGIAHDFNNLLMAILGNADLALMKVSPLSPGRENIEEVIAASKRAAELSRQMLAYSGKGKFLVEKVDLAELAKEMTHLLSVSISKKAVLRFNFADKVPPIEADATQIRQVIMNLVINASEAIGDRSGVVCISTGVMHCDRAYLNEFCLDNDVDEGYYSYIEVSDTGCGMDRKTFDRLFDPFFTTKFTGRGLGLSAVLGIVRGHHGAIKPYSEPGRGSTFKVLFPALMNEVLAESDVDVRPAARAWQPQGTVLVADDEESICAIARGMLEHFGFKVLTAADGREALEVFRQHADEIVCVVLDLTMPHMDGEACFRELRRLKKDVRVLLSSGYTEYDVEGRFAGKGLAGFVQKPYTKAEFEAALKQVLSL